MNIKTEINQLKKKLTPGSRIVYVPVEKGEDFFSAAQRLISSGDKVTIVPLRAILKEISGTSMGLPKKSEMTPQDYDRFALVNVLSGESFEGCIKRLKASHETPEIFN